MGRQTASLLARATTLATAVLRTPPPVLRCSQTLVRAPTVPSAPRQTASLLARATTLATAVLRTPPPVLRCSQTLVLAAHRLARFRRALTARLVMMELSQAVFTHLLFLLLARTLYQAHAVTLPLRT